MRLSIALTTELIDRKILSLNTMTLQGRDNQLQEYSQSAHMGSWGTG